MLPGLVTFQVQLVSFDFAEDMQAPMTGIHSLGHLRDVLNVVTISFGSWVLARLLLLSAPQYLITWLSTMHRPWEIKKDTLGLSF